MRTVHKVAHHAERLSTVMEELEQCDLRIVASPLMPRLAYIAAGDLGWLWTAAHAHALSRLLARPYLSSATSS
ncbi:MAG: hypothetical protein MUF00_12805 [Gemmatimonadaceae bacterium]|nr:hypothetical protein [Gemmatimonadaceae bacterium]